MNNSANFKSLFLQGTALLDVRAPIEFAQGAFPHASNLPLLDDQQRHEIGICYKQHGQQAAIELGHQFISGDIRAARMAQWRQWYQQNPDGHLYCFRGGLRSQTVQSWLAEEGIHIPLIPGGYKALRRFLLDNLERASQTLPMTVICGRTGCGKTRVIEALPSSLDLEGEAHHRGSSFGRRPGGQPAQIDFENRVAIRLLKLEEQQLTPVILEDESRLIGRCYLPQAMQERIANTQRVIIEESLDSRVMVTLEDYVVAPLNEYAQWFGEQDALAKLGEELIAALARIRKRLGGARYKELNQVLENALTRQRDNGDTSLHQHWIRPLLKDYYDPMYDYMMEKRVGEVLFSGTRSEVQAFLASTASQ
jgi:tRNA 2-selenouridine synthase